MSLFNSGIRPMIDAHLLNLAEKVRSYGDYWSASSAGYCMRRLIFERLGVPHVQKEDDARKQRVFTAGHLFHNWIQSITRKSGLSIAQELELQDEELMIRGHIDDLVLAPPIDKPLDKSDYHPAPGKWTLPDPQQHLILYDYKTRNSRNFNFSKNLSYYHKMQVGTYMYMLRNTEYIPDINNELKKYRFPGVTEARILNIEKDTLRMSEVQLLWSEDLEKEVLDYWTQLNGFWEAKKIPPCTCADHENGFMAKEAWNPYFYNGEPCSLELYKQFKEKKVNV